MDLYCPQMRAQSDDASRGRRLRGVLAYSLATLGLSAMAMSTAAASDVVEYYHLDALGSVRAVTDASGTIIERHDYLPYGEECITGPCASNPGLGAGQPKKFTGKERDTETGLDYFGARYFGSKIGRFTTVDPILDVKRALADPQHWNRYAYVRNNPLGRVDPDGRWDRSTLAADYRNYRRNHPGGAPLTPQQEKADLIGSSGYLAVFGLAGGGVLLESGVIPGGQMAVLNCLASPGCRNAVNGLAEGASGAPPGAFGTVPTLTATGNRALFQEALGYLTGSKGSAAEKAQLFGALAEQITERSGGTWGATRGRAANAVGVWVGEQRPFGLAIDEAGRVWTTSNIHEGATFTSGGSIVIDYSKWTQR